MKKRISETAERDRQKQVCLYSIWFVEIHSKNFQIFIPQVLDDAALSSANDQLITLTNQSPIDDVRLLDLWRSTVSIRRKETRNKTTEEIISQYPGYSMAFLVHYINLKSHEFHCILFRFSKKSNLSIISTSPLQYAIKFQSCWRNFLRNHRS